MVFLGWGSSQGEERKILVVGIVGETATSVFALFYLLFGIKKVDSAGRQLGEAVNADTSLTLSADVARLTNQCNQLQIENKQLFSDLERIRVLPERILGELGSGKSLSIGQLLERMEITDVDGVQASLGRLFQDQLIESDPTMPAGFYRVVRKKPS
jgi:hypothetical protein